VLSARVFGKSGKAEVVFAQQSKALEAIKQFHQRTLDGIPMDVKLAPRDGAPAAHAAQAAAAPQGKAAMFGTALGGQGGKGAGRQAHVEPSFSIVLPKAAANGKGFGKGDRAERGVATPAAKFDSACNICGKVGHKAAECRSAGKGAAGKGAGKGVGKGKGGKGEKETTKNPAALDKEMDDYFNKKDPAAPKAKREKKVPAAKEAAPSSADLDGDMDAYFAARNAPAAAE
jgi:hypothetical protein